MNAKVFDAMLRHGIGFNPWYFEKHMDSSNYPPHNVAQIGEDHYRVTLAVAGFVQDDLQIVLMSSKDGPLLTVSGKKTTVAPDDQRILYQGIGYRNFTSEFLIGENVEVKSAMLRDGLLEIDLFRHVPESQKPKQIPIVQTGNTLVHN